MITAPESKSTRSTFTPAPKIAGPVFFLCKSCHTDHSARTAHRYEWCPEKNLKL